MKTFSVVALSGLAAVAAAQSSTGPMSPEASCATSCDKTDLDCIAACFHVPSPDDQMANDTTDCVAKCPQGTGSPADTQAYASCANQCISSYFMTATGGPVAPTAPTAPSVPTNGAEPTSTGGSGGSGDSGSGDDSDSEGGSGGSDSTDSEGSATETGGASGTSTEAPEATGSDGAAPHLAVSGASLLGLMLAAFAL